MKYQDYVIKNGKFVGKFDLMFKKYKDPWKLLEKNKKSTMINYRMIIELCKFIKEKLKKKKITTLEIGCGFPQISQNLYENSFSVFGTDISENVIKRSRKKFPKIKKNLIVSNFINFDLYKKINADIIILSDISWYVLPDLKKFIKWYKKLKKETFLIHSLAVYGKNKQKYGKNYFYDLKSCKKFFKLNFLSSGNIQHGKENHIFFLSTNKK